MRPLSQADTDSAEIYASALQMIGDSYGWEDDWTRAKEAHLRAESFQSSLPPTIAGNRHVRTARSSNLRLLGEAHHKLSEAEPARRTLDHAVKINRQLLSESPDDPTVNRKLATSLWYRAVVHRTNERDALAGESIMEAVSLADNLRSRSPNDAGALQLFAIIGEVHAQVLADLNRFQESYAAGEAVTEAHRRLVSLAGETPGARRSMAVALRTRGGNHYNGEDYAGACAIWKEALGIFMALKNSGDLTDTDRSNGVPELERFTSKSCDPPRRGLGRKV